MGMRADAIEAPAPARDKPWIFRTYAGHSTAIESNRLYRANLAKGQTGLSIAFDLPTQTGYDSDHPLACGEVGKVGVAISHIGDMGALFREIPVATMNTSMTINATAPWLMALYIAVADEQGAPRTSLQGTTQNDIIKEYLSRGAYVFPPAPSLRLSKDLILFCARETPKWSARKNSPRSSGRSRSSSTPGCVSSRNWRKCGHSRSSGTKSPGIATASPIPPCGVSATACRSIRWASPSSSRRTTP